VIAARVVLVVALGALAASCQKDNNAAAATPPRLEIRAQVTDPQTATVAAPVDGKVARIAVREGAAVKPGDLIVQLTNAAIDRDLAYARAQLGVAEFNAQHRGTVPQRVRDDTRLRAAKAILDNRRAKLERYRGLFATHDVSRQDLEDAENEVAMAQRDYLAERDANVVAAPATDPRLLALELEKAKAEEAFAEGRLKLLAVTAPIGGVVMKVHAVEGESVFPRDPLVEIANLSTMNVQGHIAPELTRYVHAGMPVEVKVQTVPPRNFLESVKSVRPGEIVVTLPNPDGVLLPGTQATITVR
jgi:multidrug resistance efflux pump